MEQTYLTHGEDRRSLTEANLTSGQFATPKWAGWLALGLVLIGTLAAVLVWRMGFPASQGERVSVTHSDAVMVDWVPEDDPSPRLPQEDEAGWDCRTMGNRICGPVDGD